MAKFAHHCNPRGYTLLFYSKWNLQCLDWLTRPAVVENIHSKPIGFDPANVFGGVQADKVLLNEARASVRNKHVTYGKLINEFLI
ncbi:hypothetical protein [Methylomonas sp. CM2]|uniref:hypothetical protein n=1 Tax=Methylomonas sp. CM2 TaxID=3417647 RepID=UPI003CE732B9